MGRVIYRLLICVICNAGCLVQLLHLDPTGSGSGAWNAHISFEVRRTTLQDDEVERRFRPINTWETTELAPAGLDVQLTFQSRTRTVHGWTSTECESNR